MFKTGLAVGIGLGLAAAAAGCALSQTREAFGVGDHYEMAWTVLAAGQVVCVGPFVRPGEHEIECRHARVTVKAPDGR
jgi:hypothetical protein